LDLLVGMGAVIFFWIIVLLVLLGVGILIYRFLGFKISSEKNVFFFFWFGFAITVLFLQLWHMWFRIDWKAAVFILILGLTGFSWNYKCNLAFIRDKIPKSKIFWFFILIVTIIVANFSFGEVRPYDAGLYHLQSVRWIKQYPIVPGLGNLHSRLAFNNSNFLFAAMLEQNIFFLKSFRTTNSLLLLVLIMHLSVSGFRVLVKINPWDGKISKGCEEVQSYEIFELLLFPSVINIVLRGSTASLSPDIPIFILGIVLAVGLLRLMAQEVNSRKILFFIFIIAVLGITIKMSFFVFAFLSVIIAFVLLGKKKNRKDLLKSIPFLRAVLVFSALILITWLIRNIILSGYLVYPSTLISFPVEWRLPAEKVVSEARWIRSWARLPGSSPEVVLSNWNWIKPWVSKIFSKEYIFDILVPIALILEGVILLCLNRLKCKNKKISYELLLFLILPLVNLVFWFFSAPSVRFAGSSFWILGVGIFVLSVLRFDNLRKSKVILFSNFLIISFLGIGEQVPDLLRNINLKVQSVPVERMKTFKTNSGLIIYVPEKGNQCWDFKLPCTPYPKSDLQLRDKKDISKGFKIYSNSSLEN
jgi:hypothetical protein